MTDSIRLADYVADRVAQEGVDCVFLVPGGGAMHLNDAFGRHSKLRYVANHHEQASVIAAEAYARINGRLGCALVTTGPGGTNAVTPCAGAWIDSVPVLIISGQVKRADLAGDSGLRQRGPQEVDIVSIVRPITKYAITVTDPAQIGCILDEAIEAATMGRPGPVWVDIPLDVQNARVTPSRLKRAARTPQARCGDLGAQARLVAERFAESRRPLVLAGHGVRLAGAERALLDVVERLGVPVATTWNGADLVASTHPLSVGKPGSVALRGPNFAVQNADLILVVGARLDNVVTAYDVAGFGREAAKIVVDVDPYELAKFAGLQGFSLTIEADAKAFLEALAVEGARIGPLDRSEWVGRCAEWKRRYAPGVEGAFAQHGVISHYQATQALSDAIGPDAMIVTGSSGLAIEFLYSGFQNKQGQRMFLTSGLGAMGYGLPAMIGAYMASDRKPFIGIESDGSLMMNIQEMQTIASLGIPLRLFVLNNGGYASIRNTQRNYFEGRYVGSGPSSGLEIPDLVAVARVFGWDAMRIDDASRLDEGIQDALSRTGPLLVDIILMPDEALFPKCAAIPQPDGTMRSMPLEDMSPLLSRDELRRNMIIPLAPASRFDEADAEQ